MEQERFVLFAALAITIAVTVFVLWGPSNLKHKRRKGHVGGLVNLGYSCFLNTLLQAFGSSTHIVRWLSQQPQEGGVIGTLRFTLQVANGDHPEVRDDPFAPCDVLNALKAKWNISPGEQDAHELFVVLLSALEDEAQQAALPKVCSLSDALERPVASEPCARLNGHPAYPREVHSEVNGVSTSDPREVQSGSSLHSDGLRRLSHHRATTLLVKQHSETQRPRETPVPFQGTFTSSLQCTKCHFKNVVQCDKFDSLSLPLPGETQRQRTLTDLLDNYVATETVCIECNRCKIQVDFHKTLSFGKLPSCLVLHIVRTTWLADGRPLKRTDQVNFPLFLSMDKYTYTQMEGDALGRRHNYRLQAVVVHRGDLNSGHFVTYRRGKHSWLFTSDAEVMECSEMDALSASAYMLFYDKSLYRVG